jgi:hypothetical protein
MMFENPRIRTSSVLDARSAPVKAFIRATGLLDSRDLLPKVMDVTLEFADFPFLTEKALADRMHGEEVFITNEDRVNSEAWMVIAT